MQEKKNVGQATASLVLGILSLILFGILTGIPAVICGHIAKSKIKRAPEHLLGEGKALAGLIMGYISIALSVLIVPILAAIAIPLMSSNMDYAIATEGQAGCVTISAAMRVCWVEHGTLGGIQAPQDLEMIAPGDLDGTYFNDNSYAFTSLSDISNYTITAISRGDRDGADIEVNMNMENGLMTWDIVTDSAR